MSDNSNGRDKRDATPLTTADIATDDTVVAFRTVASGVTGRIVRLGPALDTILSRHNLEEDASRVLGEGLALAALLASALPDQGQIIVQAQSDGRVPFLVADCSVDGALRGTARVDDDVSAVESGTTVLGEGHLAITIVRGAGGDDRYQGIMALEGGALDRTAEAYFEQREALPTFVRLVVARQRVAAHDESGDGAWQWRAGGLMIQDQISRNNDDHADTGAANDVDDGDGWRRARILAETIEDAELLAADISTERILTRLFHEDGVEATAAFTVRAQCRCSRQKVAAVLATFGGDDMADMRDEDGNIVVSCEFCTTRYVFTDKDLKT